MKLYELTCLISAKLNKEQIGEFCSQIESLLQKESAILIKRQPEKLVTLGYEIKKQKQVFLIVMKFQMEPAKQKLFQEKLKEIPEILRFNLISLIPKAKEAKIPKIKKAPKEKKVELKDIEEKLQELLGE